ncbi:hypothetical protein [Paenibacillus sp. UNC451MF]|uniref:hypothetical protein n=1 Tax=Paenibacillus sp. UNC451MF TaxID=1449063 RepID=UPI00048E9B58|nr:hypothetical protein [Paenibacillus sp. UNC451MF]
MKLLKTRLSVLVVGTSLMLPAVVGAAPVEDAANSSSTAPETMIISSTVQTNVNGTYVPGIYVTTNDSMVAFIPGGVGLVVVNKGTALPNGAYYVD